jgi:hypothetical protein
MSHLSETGYGYFEHLLRAWKIAGVLLVHGLVPNIWKTKASDLICVNNKQEYEPGGRSLSED